MLIYAVANPIFAKVIPVDMIIVIVAFFHISKPCITIALRVEIVLFAFNRIPFSLYECRPIIILGSLIGCQPFSLQQLSVIKRVRHILEECSTRAIQSFECLFIKVIIAVLTICIRQVPPARLGHTVDGVVPCTVKFEQTCDLALASTGRLIELVEILVAFIIEARDLVDTLQGIVFDEVVGYTVDRFPAGPGAVVQDETIRELLIRFAAKMAALGMCDIFRLLIGIDPILLLEGGLLGHVVECVCAKIDIIADRTSVRNCQRLIRAVLSGHLYTTENADGVGRFRINGLALLDEIALHRKQIILVHGCGRQTEIIIRHRQVGNIHIDILVELELHRHLGLRADTLCQLEQQIPGRDAGNIAASNHGQKRLQLFRHLDRHHIQSEDIGDVHGLAGIDHMIAVCLAVAAGRYSALETSLVHAKVLSPPVALSKSKIA